MGLLLCSFNLTEFALALEEALYASAQLIVTVYVSPNDVGINCTLNVTRRSIYVASVVYSIPAPLGYEDDVDVALKSDATTAALTQELNTSGAVVFVGTPNSYVVYSADNAINCKYNTSSFNDSSCSKSCGGSKTRTYLVTTPPQFGGICDNTKTVKCRACSTLEGGPIAGIVIACVVGSALIILAIYYLGFRGSKKSSAKSGNSVSQPEGPEGVAMTAGDTYDI
jgi:hypothetical protein